MPVTPRTVASIVETIRSRAKPPLELGDVAPEQAVYLSQWLDTGFGETLGVVLERNFPGSTQDEAATRIKLGSNGQWHTPAHATVHYSAIDFRVEGYLFLPHWTGVLAASTAYLEERDREPLRLVLPPEGNPAIEHAYALPAASPTDCCRAFARVCCLAASLALKESGS